MKLQSLHWYGIYPQPFIVSVLLLLFGFTVSVQNRMSAAVWTGCSRLRYIRADSCHGLSGITPLAVFIQPRLCLHRKVRTLQSYLSMYTHTPVHVLLTSFEFMILIWVADVQWGFFQCREGYGRRPSSSSYSWLQLFHWTHRTSEDVVEVIIISY